MLSQNEYLMVELKLCRLTGEISKNFFLEINADNNRTVTLKGKY